MSRALLVLLLAIPLQTFGAITLKMELNYGEKTITPSVKVESGQVATITQDDLKIQVVAKEEDERAILSFKVFQNEPETLIGSPSITAVWGQAAELTQSGPAGTLHLKVTPTRIE